MLIYKKFFYKIFSFFLIITLSLGTLHIAKAEAGILEALLGTSIYMMQIKNTLKYYNNDENGRQELFEAMKEQQGVCTDQELNQRVTTIINNLTASIAKGDPSILDKPYNYFINPDSSFNAACSLGHNMTINKGIFSLLKTDDQIAVILAHEMAHGQKDHVIKGFEKSIPATLLATVAANSGTGGAITAPILLNYTEKVHITKPMEWEADQLAFEYLKNTDYNLGACAAVWQKVMEQYDDAANNFTGNIFSPTDHPTHTERRNAYAEALTKYANGKVTVHDSTIRINDKPFLTPAASSTLSSAERAYLIAGNLAKAYHTKKTALYEAVVENGTIKIGNQSIVTPLEGDPNPQDIAKLLNELK